MLDQLVTVNDLLSRKMLVVVSTISSTYDKLVQTHQLLWHEIWFDTMIAPELVLQRFGAYVPAIFELSADLVATISAAAPTLGKPSYMPEVPFEYTVGEDGTIALGNLKPNYVRNPNGTISPAPPAPPTPPNQSEEEAAAQAEWEQTQQQWTNGDGGGNTQT